MQRIFQFSAPVPTITEAERLKFQLSLLNLVFQGDLPPGTAAELEYYAAGRAVPIPS